MVVLGEQQRFLKNFHDTILLKEPNIRNTRDITGRSMDFYLCVKRSQLLSINTADGYFHDIDILTKKDQDAQCLCNCTERNRLLVLHVATELKTSTVNS